MSTSRSGSTLLDRLLGQFAGAISLGEVHQIWVRGYQENHLCGCGLPFRDCPFWREVTALSRLDQSPGVDELLKLQRAVVRDRTIPFASVPWMSSPRWREQRNAYELALEKLFDAVARVSGASVLVDSSKRPAHVAVLGRRFGNARTGAIHLIRDSRAVAFSLSRSKSKSDANDPNAMMQKMTGFAAAKSWNRLNLFAELVAHGVDPHIRVRYEDLVSDPRGTLHRIAQVFELGQPSDSVMPRDGQVHLPSAHTVSGNPMRMTSGLIDLKVDDEWRTAMGHRERSVVTATTGVLLRRYGYTSR